MKRIKNFTLGILGATILSLGLYACNNDNEVIPTNSLTEQKTVLGKVQISSFKRAIEEKNVVISEFSEMVASMGIQRIEIESISDNNINLKVEGLKNTFVNLQEYNFNEKKYEIMLIDDNYVISSIDNDIEVKFSAENKKFSSIFKGNHIPWDKIDNTLDSNALEYADLLVKSILLSEIIDVINTPHLPIQPNKFEGIGIGVHIDRGTAEKKCNSDHQKILAANEGWCSSGVSISCGFGLLENHACVCSTSFYSGDDC